MKKIFLSIPILAVSFNTFAAGEVFEFKSPLGKTEQCVILPQMPGAQYSKKDIEKEKEFCSINFYDGKTAMCPKTWSTSPGTIIQDVDSGLSVAEHEAKRCADRSIKTRAKFKQTMNQPKTSATYSTSSLLYYHLSRFLNTSVGVPVAVYRTIDKDVHLKRVSSLGKGTGMNAAAWNVMRKVLPNPSAYTPTDDLFTADRQQIYGILLKDSGQRYGTEINGIRSSWGDGQNLDFQKTPAFTALRSEAPLKQAILIGEKEARKDAKINSDLGPAQISGFQMTLWMKELTEITLLDYIFNQQDRIGNIDYKWYFYWLDAQGNVQNQSVDSDLPRKKMSEVQIPDDIRPLKPILVQRTQIGDNDAGGKVAYSNFTKRTKMLENIRHYNTKTYAQLIALNNDLQSHGEIYSYIANNFKLEPNELKLIVTNTKQATDILNASCKAGRLKFDLKPKEFFQGKETLESVNCATGEIQ